jgi:dihydroorotase-like cyclic amidohydrolase
MNALSTATSVRGPLLSVSEAQPAELVIRGARALDPDAGIDGAHDVVVRDGRIVELAPPGAAEVPHGAEVIDGAGLHVFPGFVDPHVHLRTPGREDEEDIESGTRAAAAGGFCCVLAMPNTDPVCDSAPLVRSLHERTRAPSASPTTGCRSRTPACCAAHSSTSGCAAACSHCTRRTPRCPPTA